MISKKRKQVFIKTKRLIKKIGVFEILVGLLFLLVLIFVMIQTRSKKEWVKAEVKISSPSWWQAYYTSPPFWLGESIKVGDKEFDSQGKIIAEVLEVKEYELTGKSGEIAREDFYLTLNLQASRNRKTGKLEFKYQPLEIGGPIELHLTDTYVYGLVTFIEGVPDERETKEIIVKGIWMNIFPWQAEVIPIGGKQEDGAGNVIAEILEKRIELSNMVVTTDDGRVLVRKNPTKRDVYITTRVLTKKQGGNLYFREDQKIKIGKNLFIQLPGIDVDYVSIMEIYDKDGKRIY